MILFPTFGLTPDPDPDVLPLPALLTPPPTPLNDMDHKSSKLADEAGLVAAGSEVVAGRDEPELTETGDMTVEDDDDDVGDMTLNEPDPPP